MATKTWDGADSSWNTPGNWSPSGVPGVGDDVVFNVGNAQVCTLDVHAECDSVTNTDYAGTLDCAAYNLTIGGDFTYTSGSLDLGSGTITVQGHWDTRGVNFTAATSTIVLGGTSKDFHTGVSEGVYNLTVSGSYEQDSWVAGVSAGTLNVTGTYTINTGKTYNAGSGHTVTLGPSGTIQDDGGTGVLQFVSNASGIDTTDGSITCNVLYRYTCAVKARAYGGDVTIHNNANADYTATVSTGTLSITGNLYVDMDGGATYSITLDCAANDPAVNVDGIIDFIGGGAGTEVILAGSSNWNAAGNIDLTGGTLTPAASKFILDGGGAQNITSDTEPFWDLTVAQAAGTVKFVDPLDVDNVHECLTPNAVLSYHDHATNDNVLDTINFAGASGQLMTIQRNNDNGVQARWNVTTNTQCDYVDVSNNDAQPGIDIDATNSNDGGNNDGWNFTGDKTVEPSAQTATGALQTPVPEVRVHAIVA